MLAVSPDVVQICSDFEHSVAAIHDADLWGAEAILLRVSLGLWLQMHDSRFFDSPERQKLVRGVRDRVSAVRVIIMPDPGSIICSEDKVSRHDIRPRELFSKDGSSPVFNLISEQDTAVVRQGVLGEVIEKNMRRCAISSSDNHHFILPSGVHTNRVMRIYDSFVSMEVVDILAYWCALEIRKKKGVVSSDSLNLVILMDSPGMLVLGSRISSFFGCKSKYFAFSSYEDVCESVSGKSRVSSFLSSEGGYCVFVNSLSLTGGLSDKAGLILSACRGGDYCFVNLYSLSDRVSALCSLKVSDYRYIFPKDECDMCASGSNPISVSDSTYLVPFVKPKEVAIGDSRFKLQRGFIEKYGNREGVLRVHYDDPNEFTKRHHAFYIDVGTLLDDEDFVSELAGKFNAILGKYDVVLIPDHAVGRKISILMSSLSLVENILLVPANLAEISDSVFEVISKASEILIVDDKVISGSRFDSINKYIRESGSSPSRLDYFALIATPPSMLSFQRRVTGLTTRHAWDSCFDFVYLVELPDWHRESDCPWCRERDYLIRSAGSLNAMDSLASGRIASLKNPREGMSNDWIFSDPQHEIPCLGGSSIVLHEGASPIQVIFAFASAIQQLRNCSDSKLDASSFPQPSCVAERVFSKNFTERLIWLAMLRCLKSNELAKELQDFLCVEVCRNIQNGENVYSHFELYIASMLHKIDLGEGAVETLLNTMFKNEA